MHNISPRHRLSTAEDNEKKGLTLSAIREAIPRMVELDRLKLLLIIQSCFKEPWSLEDIPKIISKDLPDVLCEQVGELIRVKE